MCSVLWSASLFFVGFFPFINRAKEGVDILFTSTLLICQVLNVTDALDQSNVSIVWRLFNQVFFNLASPFMFFFLLCQFDTK